MSNKILIRYKVADYASWKTYFDEVQKGSKVHGITCLNVFRDSANKNDLSLLCEIINPTKAKEFIDSKELKDIRKKAGVITKPEIYHLSNL